MEEREVGWEGGSQRVVMKLSIALLLYLVKIETKKMRNKLTDCLRQYEKEH